MLEGTLKWGAFSAAEVFVIPSHQENFGIVVAEAQACGLPVIFSEKVNIWREVMNYWAGLVGEDTIDGDHGHAAPLVGAERGGDCGTAHPQQEVLP